MVKVIDTRNIDMSWQTTVRCINPKCARLLLVTAHDLRVDRQNLIMRLINDEELVARFDCPNCYKAQAISEYELRRLGYDTAWALKNEQDIDIETRNFNANDI